MPRTIRFHLDENADPRIALGLRLHGVDITTTPDSGLLGASDETQIQHASAEARVIVTQDADFLRIAATGRSSPGVVFFHDQQCSIGDVIRGVLLIWEILEAEEMKDRVEFL